MKLGVSTTIATSEIYSQDCLTLDEKLFLSHETTLDFAEKHKLAYAELSVLDAHSIKDIDQKKYSDMLSTHNLRYTYHAPIFEINLGATSDIWRKLSSKLIIDHIKFAKAMNVENIVIHPNRSMGIDAFFLDRILESILLSLHEIRASNSTGINVLVENLPQAGELFSSPETLLLLGDTSFCYDAAHANCAGFSQTEFIKQIGSRIKEVHLIDGKKNKADMHYPVGKGDIDFKETQSALKNIRYKGPMILEAFSIEDAATSLKKLKDIFR